MILFLISQTLLWMKTEQGNRPYGSSVKVLYYNDTLFSFGVLDMGINSTNYDICIISYNMSGAKLWQSCTGGNANSNDFANDAIIGNDGYIYTTGGIRNTVSYYDIIVYKHQRTNLIPVWGYLYNSSQNGRDEGYFIVQDNSGNVYVGGSSDTIVNNTTSQKHIILSLDQNGNLRWIYKNYLGSDWGYYQGIESMAYGNNTIYGSFPYVSSTLFSLNSNNGSLNWYNSQHLPYQKIIYDNGYLYTLGRKWFAGLPKLTIDKVNAINGSSIWETIISDSISPGGKAMVKGSDGYIYVAGCAQYSGVYRYIVSKIDPQSGAKIFTKDYPSGSCFYPSIAYGDNGNLYMGGLKADSLVIYKIDTQNGNLIWKWTYPQSRIYSILYINSNPPKICASGEANSQFLTLCLLDNTTANEIFENKNLIITNNDKIIIKLPNNPKDNFKVIVFSIDGKKIYEEKFDRRSKEIFLKKPSKKGVYIIKIESIGNFKIVI